MTIIIYKNFRDHFTVLEEPILSHGYGKVVKLCTLDLLGPLKVVSWRALSCKLK